VRWQARRDGDRLALAIASTDARIDAEPAGHGDRLTLMLRQGGRHMRLAIRHTPNGPMVTASRDGRPPRPGPAHGIRAAVGGDPRQPSHLYELSLPLADWFTPGDEPTRTLRVAAALWDRAHHDGRHPLVVLPAPGGGSLRWPMP